MSKGPKNPQRSFGISVGSVLCVLAAILLLRHRALGGQILGGIGVVLVVLGLTAPALLAYPSKYWWTFSLALGRAMARFWLTLLFLVALTPVSLVWRVMGRDPLARRREKWPGWSPRPNRYRSHKHYRQMY
jgi:hypothetical protein